MVTRDVAPRPPGADQRRRIRRAVAELVAKRGYRGLSVGLIVERARVSPKTYYQLYGNKEEAFIDLFNTTLARTRALVEARVAAAGGEWPERVAVAIRAFFEAISAEPLVARACLVEAPTAGPHMLELYERIPEAFLPLVGEGRDHTPEARALPEVMEETLVGAMLWSAYQRLNFAEAEKIPELIPENIELVLRPFVGQAEAERLAGRLLAG